MPETSGLELAQHIKALRPDMKTLDMSASADDILGPRGVISAGDNFLQKPFTPPSRRAKCAKEGPARHS